MPACTDCGTKFVMNVWLDKNGRCATCAPAFIQKTAAEAEALRLAIRQAAEARAKVKAAAKAKAERDAVSGPVEPADENEDEDVTEVDPKGPRRSWGKRRHLRHGSAEQPSDAQHKLADALLEIARLQESNAQLKASQISSTDAGVLSSIGVARGRDVDFPEFVRAIELAPMVLKNFGRMRARTYCRVHLRSLLSALCVVPPRTPDLVMTRHRLFQCLTEGQWDVLCESGYAGAMARIEFAEACEQYTYAISIQAAYQKDVLTPSGQLPTRPTTEE